MTKARARTSLRAFARGLGVTKAAVQRAIKDGRLTKATVGLDAKRRPFIRDVEAARAEWEAHTRPRVAAQQPGGSAAPLPAPSKLAAATQRERDARAALAELEYQRKSRDLVPAAEVETRWSALVVGARTTLLALPTRARQRLPHLTSTDVATLEALVREALVELADTAPQPQPQEATA